MLVFVFHRAPGLAKVCQNSWVVNESNVQSSISFCSRLFCTLRCGPQLTFVPSTWQSSLCCQADLDWKTQGGDSDMSQTLSAMAMISYPGIVTLFLPLLKYLNSCCFNKLSFAPSFGKSFLPGWLPYTLHSPWAGRLLSTTLGLCERIMTSKVRAAKGSDQLNRWLSHLEKIDEFQMWK